MEGKAKETNKDLLELEHKNPSSSALDSTLLVCTEKKKKKKIKTKTPSKPTITPLPKSEVLDKVKGFIGIMAEANKRLELESKGNSEAFDIETLTGNESQVIEMDLMLGVADLNTPEAVNAAEAAIAGNCVVAESGDSSSDEEEAKKKKKKKRSLGEESSRKRSKIIELS